MDGEEAATESLRVALLLAEQMRDASFFRDRLDESTGRLLLWGIAERIKDFLAGWVVGVIRSSPQQSWARPSRPSSWDRRGGLCSSNRLKGGGCR